MSNEASLRAPIPCYTDPPMTGPGSNGVGLAQVRPKLRLVAQPECEPEVALPNQPAEEWLRRICLAILEVVHHRRAPTQLRGIVSSNVLRQLELRRQFASSQVATSLLSLHLSPLTQHVLELSASFQIGQRVFPLALRIEQSHGQWLVTACEIGPH